MNQSDNSMQKTPHRKAKQRKAKQRKACVIGDPITHSRSPTLHGFWIKHYQLNACYVAESIKSDELSGFFDHLRRNNQEWANQEWDRDGYYLCGGNVTIPHKQAVMKQVDVCDPVARALGAVNTFWFEGDALHGSNTDVHGFLANLDEQAALWDHIKPDKDQKRALVLGAGGAARAVVYGLINRQFDEICIANRTVERAQELCQNFSNFAAQYCVRLSLLPWADIETVMDKLTLLVNTTSLGMAGQPPLTLSLDALSPEALVTDIVYTPLQTELLKAAKARGNPMVDGLGMLLHQAVPGFEKWFGVRPQVTPALRRAVMGEH